MTDSSGIGTLMAQSGQGIILLFALIPMWSAEKQETRMGMLTTYFSTHVFQVTKFSFGKEKGQGGCFYKIIMIGGRHATCCTATVTVPGGIQRKQG